MEKTIELGIYAGILAIFMLGLFLTRKEEVPEAWDGSTGGSQAIRVPFLRMAAGLWRAGAKMSGRIPAAEREKRRYGGSERIRASLQILYPAGDRVRRERSFLLWKISTVLLFFLLADVLAMAVWISERQSAVIGEGGRIARENYGGSAAQWLLQAQLTGEEGDAAVPEEYVVTVGPRRYTPEETERLAQKAFEELGAGMTGENRSLQEVHTDLYLPASLGEYPFQISWESSSYALVGSDGKVSAEGMTQEERKEVELTATLRYAGLLYTRVYRVVVSPRRQSEQEIFHAEVERALARREQESAQEPWYTLPAEVAGRELTWNVKGERYSLLLFVLVAAVGIVGSIGMNGELHRRIAERERQLRLDYPQMISRFVLLLGAGMSVRNVFFRLGEDYRKKRQRGAAGRFVYEEILLLCHELESGVPETEAYAHFGSRCRLRWYTKFCSLLAQNQKKGNQTLLALLREEAGEAFAERRNIARQMGEEAGTKLLLPMIMMLGITMVMIIVPAYGSFSM